MKYIYCAECRRFMHKLDDGEAEVTKGFSICPDCKERLESELADAKFLTIKSVQKNQ